MTYTKDSNTIPDKKAITMTTEYVLGIDVSKDTLSIYDSRNKKVITIENIPEAITKTCITQKWSQTEYTIGLESTGDYSLVSMTTLVKLGFEVKLLNPILTAQSIKRTVRGTKTDALDSKLIAELVKKGEGYPVTEQSLNLEKKATVRIERKLTSIGADLKKLHKSIQEKQKSGVSMQYAEEAMLTLIDQVEEAKARLWQALTSPELSNELTRQEEIIASHIGCGVKLSTIISEEAGDITRFESASALIAFAGIDPKVTQSGSMDIRGRMTKRGNTNLRHALYLAASIARIYDPELKAYFDKKQSEGKHFTVAVCAVSRKMCERIYATVKNDRLYEKRGVLPKKEKRETKETVLTEI